MAPDPLQKGSSQQIQELDIFTSRKVILNAAAAKIRT